VGSPIAGRTHRDTEGLIGFFVNTLVMRADLAGNASFGELLAQVKETTLGAYAHQDIPFEKLVEELQPVRDLSRQPIFQVSFAFQNVPQERLDLPGLALCGTGGEHVTAKFDLALFVSETPSGLRGAFEYAMDLFDRGTIERLVGYFETLLEGIVADPGQRSSELPLLREAERQRLLEEWHSTEVTGSRDCCIHDLFAQQVARTPDAVAVVYENQALSYAELDRRANQLAACLRALGAGPDVIVGLCIERSPDMVVGMLGILKAGGAYLPLDPAYPAERLAFILEDARASLIVTHSAMLTRLSESAATRVCLDQDWERIAEHSASMEVGTVAPENLAYVIYTSGSTGTPKGTLITHECVTRLFAATETLFEFGSADVWTLFHSLAFDFSVWEVWGALLYGGRLVVVPFWISRSPESFYELLCSQEVTVLNQTPTAFGQLIRTDELKRQKLALRWVIFGGEALSLADLRLWVQRHGIDAPRLVNMYGITETTVHVTHRPIAWADLDGYQGMPNRQITPGSGDLCIG